MLWRLRQAHKLRKGTACEDKQVRTTADIMANVGVLESWSNEEVRSVVRCEWVRGLWKVKCTLWKCMKTMWYQYRRFGYVVRSKKGEIPSITKFKRAFTQLPLQRLNTLTREDRQLKVRDVTKYLNWHCSRNKQWYLGLPYHASSILNVQLYRIRCSLEHLVRYH